MTNFIRLTPYKEGVLRRMWVTPGVSLSAIERAIGHGLPYIQLRAVELNLPPRPPVVLTGWTDERVERLRELWADGLSAAQIAQALGGITRNAVIGRVHRMGLAGRAKPSAPARAAKPPRAPKVAKPARNPLGAKAQLRPAQIAAPPTQVAPVRQIEEAAGSATILTLGAHMCRWPIGSPDSDDFSFCGARQGKRAPYCERHASIGYQPARKRSAAELAADDQRRFRAMQRQRAYG